jgi:hypothetical protein
MSSSNLSALVSLDPEDLTPKQLRKILNGIARSQLPYAKKTKEEQDKDKEDADEESNSLANLKEETNGKAPKVEAKADDFPAELAGDDEEEGDEKPKKKGKV